MKQFKIIATYFEQIKHTQGSNAKKAILETMRNDSRIDSIVFDKVLKHLFSSNVITGIAKISWNKATIGQEYPFADILDIITYIENNNSGKNETVETLKWLESQLTTEKEKNLLYYLATRDVQIGLSQQSIQKSYGILNKFEIMLGSKRDDKLNLQKPFILTEKLDGINLTVINDDTVKMYTRNGKEVTNLTQLEKEYKTLPKGVYCGEVLYSGHIEDRNELYRSTVSEIHTDKEDKQVIHNLFDYVTLDDWNKKKTTTTYLESFRFLNSIITDQTPHITVVKEVFQGTCDLEKLDEMLSEAKNKDWEGLMLRYTDSQYEWKRSKSLIKLKPMYNLDLRITGYGEHKNGNKLGQFSVNYYGETVWVGSGYKDEERVEFWKNRQNMVGKIIEIQYMEETQNKDGKKSLRFPIFKRLRLDKDEESYN